MEKIEQPLDQDVCSGEVREITKDEIKNIKTEISRGASLIKSYNGPSSKWFQYQDGGTLHMNLRGKYLSSKTVPERPMRKSARVTALVQTKQSRSPVLLIKENQWILNS